MLFGLTASVFVCLFAWEEAYCWVCFVETPKLPFPCRQVIRFMTIKNQFSDKYSLFNDFYAVADGLQLYLQEFWCDYTKHFSIMDGLIITIWENFLYFAPSWVVIACSINAPGSIHDSAICEWVSIHEKLEASYHRTGGTCLLYSAFGRGIFPFLIKSYQDVQNKNHYDDTLMAKQAKSPRKHLSGHGCLSRIFSTLKKTVLPMKKEGK